MAEENTNENYYEEYDEYHKKPHGKVYKTLRALFLAAVAVLLIFMFMRIHVNNHAPANVEATLWDDEAYSAYTEDSEGFSLLSYTMESYYSGEGNDTKRVVRNPMTANENIKFTAVEYMPDVRKLQFTVRYNEASAEKYSGNSTGEHFFFLLLDDKGNVYKNYSFKAFSQRFLGIKLYNYRRLLFSDIDLTDTETLTLYIYDINSAITEDGYIDKIVIYDSALPFENKKTDPPEGPVSLTPAPVTRGNSQVE